MEAEVEAVIEIVGYSIQTANNKAFLAHVQVMLERGLQDHARINGLTIIGEERDQRVVYGSMVETGEMVLDEDGDEYPERVWVEQDESTATLMRVTLEAKAVAS